MDVNVCFMGVKMMAYVQKTGNDMEGDANEKLYMGDPFTSKPNSNSVISGGSTVTSQWSPSRCTEDGCEHSLCPFIQIHYQ